MFNLYRNHVRYQHIVVLSLLVLALGACAQVPMTGRKGLSLVSGDQMNALSQQEYRKVLTEARLSRDSAQVAQLKRVGENIARAAEAFLREDGREQQITGYQWEFNLIEDDKTVNAWCMPGGRVAFYTGILPYTRDETGLAVVMGHEVAHALAAHGRERMSQAMLANMGGMALSVALSQKPRQTSQWMMAAYGLGSNVGIMLPFSRLHESEADHIGLILMARAGYDPRAAIPFWERMNQSGEKRSPEFLATHPNPERRIAKLTELMPEALVHYRPPVN